MTAEPQRRRVEEGLHKDVTEAIIGACIEVHRHLGPGLLESIYQLGVAHEFSLRQIPFQREVRLPANYKGLEFDAGYRIDFIVADRVIVELKVVEHILPIHTAQLMTYMRLKRKNMGLLINFNTPVLVDGVVRRVLDI